MSTSRATASTQPAARPASAAWSRPTPRAEGSARPPLAGPRGDRGCGHAARPRRLPFHARVLNLAQPRTAHSARHTRCGVAGMSRCVTPSGARASMIAFITAAGAAMVPASPAPLAPSGLVDVRMPWSRSRWAAGGRRGAGRSPSKRAGQELAAAGVVDDLLHQGLADALDDAAMDLALDDHRVDHRAEVVDGQVAVEPDDAGLGIDLDLGDMGADRPGEVVGFVETGLVQARLQLVMGEVVGHIGLQRDLAERHLPVGAGDAEGAVGEFDIGWRRPPAGARRCGGPWRSPCRWRSARPGRR